MRFGQVFASGVFLVAVLLTPVIGLMLLPAVAFMIYSDYQIELRERAADTGKIEAERK